MKKLITLLAIFTLLSCSKDDNTPKPKGNLQVNDQKYELNYAYLIPYVSGISGYESFELYFSDKPILFHQEPYIIVYTQNTEISISLNLYGIENNFETIENIYPKMEALYPNNPKPSLMNGRLIKNITYTNEEFDAEEIITNWKNGNVLISKSNGEYKISFELEIDTIFLTGEYKGDLIRVEHN